MRVLSPLQADDPMGRLAIGAHVPSGRPKCHLSRKTQAGSRKRCVICFWALICLIYGLNIHSKLARFSSRGLKFTSRAGGREGERERERERVILFACCERLQNTTQAHLPDEAHRVLRLELFGPLKGAHVGLLGKQQRLTGLSHN